MKQTAVEWLKMQLEIRSGIKEITVDSKTFEELCEQAKEIEAKQKGYSEKQVKQAITNFYMNDFLLTEEKLTKVINDLKQQEQ
jgi:mannitol-specific phosphotransferase system IIBC component